MNITKIIFQLRRELDLSPSTNLTKLEPARSSGDTMKDLYVGAQSEIFGFGYDNVNGPIALGWSTGSLRKANSRVLANEMCHSRYPFREIQDDKLCAVTSSMRGNPIGVCMVSFRNYSLVSASIK